MPILDLQQRARELGRIRIGVVAATKSGGKRPAKIDTFRFTSASRPLLEQIAQLYGGEVKLWQPQGGGPAAYEVITTTTRIPVLVPPQPVSQWYELWSGGGCQRRCDGAVEVIQDRACLCDAEERMCKPTTRLNVMLAEVHGLGVWRLETHGYYAAVELPSAAQFLARGGGYIDGFLALEQRRVKSPDGVKDFMVPTLEVGVTPRELLAGSGVAAQIAQAAVREVQGSPARAALEAAVPDYVGQARAATSVEQVQALWRAAGEAGHLTEALKADLMDIGNSFLPTTRAEQPPAVVDAPAGDADGLWMQIVAAAPEGMTTTQLEDDFAFVNGGVLPESATVDQLQTYLQHLKGAAA